MPKEVDTVLLMLLQELTEPVATPTIDDYLYFGYAAGGIGRKIKIETLAAVIADQLGSAAVLPDRVYRPFTGIPSDMPTGSSIGNGTDYGFTGTNNVIIDPYLDGKVFTVFRRGPMSPADKGPEWQNDIPGGGVRLTQIGDEFVNGDNILIHFQPNISSVVSTPDAVARFTSGEQEITASTAAGPGNDRKLIIIKGAIAAAPTYTLNAAYPENVLCVITTASDGVARQAIVSPPGGQTIWAGKTRTRIVLGRSDFCILVRIGNVWRVVSRGERWQRVGKVNWFDIEDDNSIYASGQTIPEDQIPAVADRLTEIEAAKPGSVLSPGSWATNKTQWGRGGGNIYVPDLRGWFPRFMDMGAGKDADRNAAGDGQKIGTSQGSQNLAHNHNNPDGGFDQLMRKTGTFTNGSPTDSTPGEPNIISSGTILSSGGTEARSENVAGPATISI